MPEDYHTTDRSNDCLLDSDGNLLDDYAEVIETGARLCVLPIARTHLEWSALTFPGGITFYPPGHVDLDILNVVPNRGDSKSLAESCSAASGVTEETLANHTLVVFPCRFDWDKVLHNSHNNHLDFIRKLSEHIDQTCLNLIRYRQCPIDKVDCLPGRAGQLESNHMMSGALLYRHEKREAKIIGGAAFSHFFTKGLGLPIESIPHDDFPKDGEVGFIVKHALGLYTAILEAENYTTKFIQCLGLLEFLAYPHDYERFEKVKKVIARYVATNASDYDRLLDRFLELTGKKDAAGRNIGYRTCMVHMGKRIEDLVPDEAGRTELFLELYEYIKNVIDHMIGYSDKTFEEYKGVRETLRPFNR